MGRSMAAGCGKCVTPGRSSSAAHVSDVPCVFAGADAGWQLNAN
jgi:hypothetical protein